MSCWLGLNDWNCLMNLKNGIWCRQVTSSFILSGETELLEHFLVKVIWQGLVKLVSSQYLCVCLRMCEFPHAGTRFMGPQWVQWPRLCRARRNDWSFVWEAGSCHLYRPIRKCWYDLGHLYLSAQFRGQWRIYCHMLIDISLIFHWVLSQSSDFQEHYCVAYAINDALVCPYATEILGCMSNSNIYAFYSLHSFFLVIYCHARRTQITRIIFWNMNKYKTKILI